MSNQDLQALDQKVGALQRAFGEVAHAHQKKADAEAAAKIVELETKLISTQYDKAAAYTNVFVIGGYAAFWALWTATKQYLLPAQALAAAILMLVSVVAFVFFEVYKQHHISKSLLTRFRILNSPENRANVQTYVAALKTFESDTDRFNVGFIKYWAFTSYLSVGSAFGAVVVLAVSFFLQLL